MPESALIDLDRFPAFEIGKASLREQVRVSAIISRHGDLAIDDEKRGVARS